MCGLTSVCPTASICCSVLALESCLLLICWDKLRNSLFRCFVALVLILAAHCLLGASAWTVVKYPGGGLGVTG